MNPRRRLYLFSPLPPQRNGLADYIMAYLPQLAHDFDLQLVAESGHSQQARAALPPGLDVKLIDEAHFLAQMGSTHPSSNAQMLYNLGNNDDCAYQLDHLHRYPGVAFIHDISLFYLHQCHAQQARLPSSLGQSLARNGYAIPEDFMAGDGSVTRTPGTLYQECLMLAEIAQAATGVMVHTAYARQRLGGAVDPRCFEAPRRKPLAQVPHFVLPAPTELDAGRSAAILQRLGIQDQDFLMLVPGFLTGNKMLYEVLVCYDQLRGSLPHLRLVFAGEERPSEYPLSERIQARWQGPDAPQVTGYLDAEELDILLQRADLSYVLRFPTYGESSGILPRAAMGGGEVITVDIGAYPEFNSPVVSQIEVGSHSVTQLMALTRAAHSRWTAGVDRGARRAEGQSLCQHLSPQALYPRIKALLDESWETLQ